jgi:hypothetical protein
LGVETREAIAVFCGIGLIVSLPFGDLPAGPECGIFSDTTSPPLITGRM